MKQLEPFPSLATLQARHRKLQECRSDQDDSEAFLADIETFVRRGTLTGALLDAEGERWEAQNLLDYWARELTQAHREVPDSELVPFAPSLAPELDDSLCPYLGLEAFGTAKQSFFFGRDALVTHMIEKLKYSRFLAIVGPSGSGKSSVALAGLLPQLQSGALHDSKTWHYFPPIVPGSYPQANLARMLQSLTGRNDVWQRQMAKRLLINPALLTAQIDKRGDEPAVFVIDQFEEIFTLCEDDNRRRAFVNALLHLVESPGTRHTVIVTMRTEFESSLVQLPALQTLFEQTQVRVPAMKVAELHEAIEKPAALVGLKFDEGLVDALIRDILGKPAALPLLQFTLLKLWQNREHNRVTWEAYRRLGGGRQTLANSANAFYESLSKAEQRITRQIFLEVVQPSPVVDVTRNRVLRRKLYHSGAPKEQIDRMLQRVIDAGLLRLMPGNRPEDDQVEIAHEALVRIWPRLVAWVEEERVAQRRRLRLATTAEQWAASGRDSSLLLRGLLLEEATHYDDLNEAETDFVEASLAAADEERLQKEAARRRELEQARALTEVERRRAQESARFARRLSRFATALALVFIVAVVAAVWAARNGSIASQNAATAVANEAIAEELRVTAEYSAATAVAARSTAQSDANLRATAEAEARAQQDVAEVNAMEAENARATAEASAAEAEEARRVAEANALEAGAQSRLATARELAATAIDQLTSDPQLSLLLALEAVNVTFSADQTAPAEAEDALYRALQASQLQFTLSGHTDRVSDVAFSPDGTRLATSSYDTNVKIWDTATGQELQTLMGHGRAVNAVAFSPDGTLLASGGDDGFVVLWDAATGNRLGVMNGDSGTVRALAFSPDGTLVAAANGDFTVRLWEIDSQRSRFRLFGHSAPLRDVAFSPDGVYFATAGEDGRIIVWDTETGSPVFPINPPSGSELIFVNSVAFSPDGQQLVATYDDGTAKTWDFETGDHLFTLTGHGGAVFDAAFSPGGTLLATASADGAARAWHADTGQSAYILSGHNGGVNAVAFSPDGRRLATVSEDGTAKIWNATPGIDLLVLSGHRAPLFSAVFNAGGTQVATTSDDNTARVWDATTGLLLQTFADHNAPVRDATFSPDGTFLATASDDFNARIWDLDTGTIRLPVLDHRGPVNAVALNSDGSLLATGSGEGMAYLWDVEAGRALAHLDHNAAVLDVAFSPDDRYLAGATADGRVLIWDFNAEDVTLTLFEHEGPVNDITFSNDGNYLATAGSDGTARLWDLQTGTSLRTFTGHTGAVLSVAISPDGTRLATASVDRTAKLWNTETGQALRTLLAHTSTVSSVAFSPDGTRLVTTSFDRTAQINELNPLAVLFERALARTARSLTSKECAQYLRGRPCLTTQETGGTR